MTEILFRQVLIESAEQAEALPVGAVALTDYHGVAIRLDYGLGWSGAGDEMSFHHEEMVGGTALVPIEAEEETTGALVDRVGEIRWEESTRLVTPWTPTEEA